MNRHRLTFRGQETEVLASGAVFWPDLGLLCVSDLHLGKSSRAARRAGMLLPPYETRDTLDRLSADIAATTPETVVCLGDSFDDLAAARDLAEEAKDHLQLLMAGRAWVWIEGNHDPGPVDLGGSHVWELQVPPLCFRHIGEEAPDGEVSGHFHPKARVSVRGRSLARRCVLVDAQRMILPAYGTYTGGLHCSAPELKSMMAPGAQAILLGPKPVPIPFEQAG